MKLTRKSQEFKSLKIKYFWQQKFLELCYVLMGIFGPYYFSIISTKLKFGCMYWVTNDWIGFELILSHWLSGIYTLFLVGLVTSTICKLVESNLKKADKRASKELGIK